MRKSLLLVVLAFAFSPAVLAQKALAPPPDPKTTEAYSLLIQRKVKVQAELDTLVSEHSANWPPAKQLDFELTVLKSELKKMAEVEESKVIKLTSGFGGLLLRRVSLVAETQMLLEEEGPEWPTLKQK